MSYDPCGKCGQRPGENSDCPECREAIATMQRQLSAPVEPSAWAKSEAMNAWVEIHSHGYYAAVWHLALRLDAARQGEYERGFYDARAKMNTALKMVFGRASVLSEDVITAVQEAFKGHGPVEPPKGGGPDGS